MEVGVALQDLGRLISMFRSSPSVEVITSSIGPAVGPLRDRISEFSGMPTPIRRVSTMRQNSRAGRVP